MNPTEAPHAQAMSLAQFQAAFAGALLAPVTDVLQHASPGTPMAGLLAQPAFAVYRNTVIKGCIDALEANFPSVARLVGSQWFRAAAALHVVQSPPCDARLLHYGAEFPLFLRNFAPAAELPYLEGVAQLDRLWCASHVAADAAMLAAATLARLPLDQLGTTRVAPHPAARWAWFDAQPIYTIWRRNRPASPAAEQGEGDIDWRSEGALLTRRDGVVQWQAASRADCAFLDACAGGATLAQAAGAAGTVDPTADIASLLAGLLRAGAFCELDTNSGANPVAAATDSAH